MKNYSIATRLTGPLLRTVCSRYVGIPLAILVLCLAGALQYRQSRLAGVADIGDPFDVDALGYANIDPAENAASDYRTAARLYRGTHEPSWEDVEKVLKHGWSAASADVHRWLEDNRAALSAWRTATEKDDCLDVQPAEMTVFSSWRVRECRDLLPLANLEAERLRFRGDTEAAWEWHRASLRCTRHLTMNVAMIDRLRAATLYHVHVERILPWSRDITVGADQLSQAHTDVRDTWLLSSPLSASIRAEFFISRDTSRLLELEEIQKGINQYPGTEFDELYFDPRHEFLLRNEPEFTRRLLRHQIANLLRFADEPLSKQPVLLPGDFAWFDFDPASDSELLSPSEFQTAVEGSLVEHYLLLRRNFLRCIHRERAHHGLLELLLAAEWHRRVSGEFPATVAELVNGPLLTDVPLDPMSRIETPLRYQRDPENSKRARVWSVGEDGVDDGGDFALGPSSRWPRDLGFLVGETAEQSTSED